MGVTQYTQPTIPEFIRVVNQSLRENAVVVLCVDCEVEYDGRAAGYLGVGERIVICKPDGTILVHRPRDHDPVNWQPPGSTITAEETDDHPVIRSRRSNPEEHITVVVHELYSITRFDADDTAPLRLEGTESDMHRFIQDNPDAIEPDLRIIEHERDTPYGSIDFFANDADGHPVIIEVKRRQASLTHVDQLRRYLSLYRESNGNTRGVLVAPTASEKVKRTLRDHGLEFVKIDAFSEIHSGITRTTFADYE